MTEQSTIPAAPAQPKVIPQGTQFIDKVGDFLWKGFMELFWLSYGIERYLDRKGRDAGASVFKRHFSGNKGNLGFSADDLGELFSLAGKGVYFGIPALLLVYYLWFVGALLCFFLFIAYFFFRARYLREEEKREIEEIETLVAKEQK
jgi:hypothetical protein